jgi:hypothetical protein
MDKIRLLLTLITIAIIAVPIVGMLLAYQDNLLGLFIPPEMNQIANDLMSGGDLDELALEPVGPPQYDEATRTFSVTFQFKNSFPVDITVKSLSGDIECVNHSFPLGNAHLSEPVSIDRGETGTLMVLFTWTDEAINHCGNLHGDEELVDVVLVDFAVDISGIQIQMEGQMEQNMQVPNPALME